MTIPWPTPAARRLLADLIAGIDALRPDASELRRELHANPRVSGDEADTAARMRRWLGDEALTAPAVAQHGFLHRVGPAGPAVGVRAELDALPILEETGVPWASVNGAMHACGHDVHMAATWALLRAASRVNLPAGLVGVFQPREEAQPCGARDVVRSSVLQDEGVVAMIGAHVQPRLVNGLVSTGVGGVNASADEFEVTIHGSGGHGAYPHVTVDPIAILGSVLSGLNQLTSRVIDPTHATVVTVGHVWAGSAANVIPTTAHLRGIVRATTQDDRERLHADIRRLVQHTASARGGDADVHITIGDPVLDNDRDLVRATDPMVDVSGMRLALEPFRSCGADDFSHYGDILPILMMFVGTGNPTSDDRVDIGLHHSRFLPDEQTIRDVAVALAAAYVGSLRASGLASPILD